MILYLIILIFPLSLTLQLSSFLPQDHDSTFLWGTYKPMLYFSVKNRDPIPTTFGLMWFPTQSQNLTNDLRHSCRDRDENSRYTWLYHDGRSFAVEELIDGKNNAKITVEFIKLAHINDTQDWTFRVRGEAINDKQPFDISLVLYATTENPYAKFRPTKVKQVWAEVYNTSQI